GELSADSDRELCDVAPGRRPAVRPLAPRPRAAGRRSARDRRAVDDGGGHDRRVGELDRDAIPRERVVRTARRAGADRDRLRSRSGPVCRAERLDASLTARCVVTRRPAREAVQSPREHTLRVFAWSSLSRTSHFSSPRDHASAASFRPRKGEVRAESPQLRLPGIGEDLLLQLGPSSRRESPPRRCVYPPYEGYTHHMAQAPALPTGFELPLEPRLPRIGSVDQVAVEARATDLSRRSIKREAKLFALDLAVRMIDLTTLEGADTPGKVAALASKAMRPDPSDASIPSVAAVCVYPNLVQTARERVGDSGVKVASVATAFPPGQ